MLIALSSQLDFEYELYEAPYGTYGNVNENGDWDGVVQELLQDVRSANSFSIDYIPSKDIILGLFSYYRCSCTMTISALFIKF